MALRLPRPILLSLVAAGLTASALPAAPRASRPVPPAARPVRVARAAVQPAAEGARAKVRFLCFAPSPYTHRHDALRAGVGIALSLRRLAREHDLEIKVEFYDGSEALDDPTKAAALLHGAKVLVVGGSTWAQGSSRFLRRFFELTGGESLWGVSATAWATAGGMHTGGERVIEDTYRSLMGMGANVFSLGQKLMVFTTDERTTPPVAGEFDLLDCWFMEQHAKAIAVAALDHGSPGAGEKLAQRLALTHTYYKDLPRDQQALRARYGELQEFLNAAADPKSQAYRKLRTYVSEP